MFLSARIQTLTWSTKGSVPPIGNMEFAFGFGVDVSLGEGVEGGEVGAAEVLAV